ncbi:hypothetical protein BC826DRAFT_61833 [Russula brevipes]|nr:hypothetical protein BC826DRAFT_61833 [Russula brevipes]
MASGKLWDNLGSTTFVTTKGGADKTRLSKRGEWRRRIAESSDDELDFLSSSSRSDDVEQLTAAKSKLKTKKQLGKAVIQGQEADCRPDHPPKRKLPNFKKITNAAPGGTSTSRGGTSNATHKAPKQTKSYGILATLHDNKNERLSGPSDGPSSDKDSFDGSTYASISPQQKARKFPGLTLSPLRSVIRTRHTLTLPGAA